MKSLFQDWMARDHGEPSWRKRRYLFSIGLAVALLLAGVAVYGRAQWEYRRGLAMGWSEGLPMLAMAYGSLLLLAIAVLESRVRHARQDDLILRGRTLSNIVDYITQIQEQERHEISSLLHDKMGAMLTAVKLEVELLAQRHHVPAAEIKHVEALLQESLNEIRGITSGLYPRSILNIGLRITIEDVIARIGKMAQAPVIETQWKGEFEGISEESALCVVRVVQECLMNVVRHAKARHVRVNVGLHQNVIEGCVEDDGTGMKGGETGLGLMMIGERLSRRGGSLLIGSSGTGGVKVAFKLPAMSVVKRGGGL